MSEQDKTFTPIQMPPWVPCAECRVPLNFEESVLDNFFFKRENNCPECYATLDWWKITLNAISVNFMQNQAFMTLGAKSTIFKIRLIPGMHKVLKFADHSIPDTARILYVNYTANSGNLVPIEMHGNVPQRHIVPSEVTLYAVPRGSGDPCVVTEVCVFVTWVPNTIDDEVWQNLVDACEAFVQGRYESMVIPSNIVVESKLNQILFSFLDNFASK